MIEADELREVDFDDVIKDFARRKCRKKFFNGMDLNVFYHSWKVWGTPYGPVPKILAGGHQCGPLPRASTGLNPALACSNSKNSTTVSFVSDNKTKIYLDKHCILFIQSVYAFFFWHPVWVHCSKPWCAHTHVLHSTTLGLSDIQK